MLTRRGSSRPHASSFSKGWTSLPQAICSHAVGWTIDACLSTPLAISPCRRVASEPALGVQRVLRRSQTIWSRTFTTFASPPAHSCTCEIDHALGRAKSRGGVCICVPSVLFWPFRLRTFLVCIFSRVTGLTRRANTSSKCCRSCFLSPACPAPLVRIMAPLTPTRTLAARRVTVVHHTGDSRQFILAPGAGWHRLPPVVPLSLSAPRSPHCARCRDC